MDLLERARALAACPLFADLAPAVVIRLAERARPATLEPGERRTTDDTVWIIVAGSLVIASRAAMSAVASISTTRRHGGTATAGMVLGLIRVIAPATPALDAVAEQPSTVIGVALDDIRDVLEEDPVALSALSGALAKRLLEGTT
ncbi:MAG: Crp/Fnr family transcriptional regulator [Myxococcales bacterium]|nr:Crp/Fnr family transcriptional regulator [Myxococcales bacterium]